MLERVEELVEAPYSLSGSNETPNWNESGLQAIANLKQMAGYLEVFIHFSFNEVCLLYCF